MYICIYLFVCLFIYFAEDDEVSSSPDTSRKVRHSLPTFPERATNFSTSMNSAQSVDTLPEISNHPCKPCRTTFFQTDELEEDWEGLR